MKKNIINIISFIFLCNLILIIVICNLFLSKNINEKLENEKKDLENLTYEIINNIEDENFLLNISQNKKILIIYDNQKYGKINENNLTYSVSKEINNKILTVFKNANVTISSVIKKVLLIECFIIFLLSIIGYIFANKRIIVPVRNLISDMKEYKNGKMPKMRPLKNSIDAALNSFVNLTETLESEKRKQNEIIASISHDIKTPLTSIIGYTARLENASLDDITKAKYISKISSKANNIKDIIDEFDDYLKMNLKMNLNLEKILIKDLLKMIKNEYEEDLTEKNIKLKINCNLRKDYIFIDVGKIKRVFGNIISNSIRFTENEIIINCIKKEDFYYFKISDNGIGVPIECLNKIFDPLYTTDSSRKISGLGLSICKQIILLHDGKIWASNNNKKGLTITFTIQEKKLLEGE